MTQELIINGQAVDIAGVDITLEYVSGLFQDIGSISLSRSYTIQLPKTRRNLQILDDPGNPAHDSATTRRYLDAYYYRNGVDLLGKAQAYVLGVTNTAIEIGLIWRQVDNLLEWRDSGKKLSDISGLPTLTWIGEAGTAPDYAVNGGRTDYFFAQYFSGLTASYPNVNAAPHPVVSFFELFSRIFNEAGVRYSTSTGNASDPVSYPALANTALLADGHRPSRAMEIASGSSAASASAYDGIGFSGWSHGWDPVVTEYSGSDKFEVGEDSELRFVINLKNGLDGYTIGDSPIKVVGVMRTDGKADAATIAEFYFETDENGVEHCTADEIVNLAGYTDFRIDFDGAPASRQLPLPAYDSALPAFSVMHSHEHIVIAEQNEFPLADNLPDMTQVDFIKGACALLGIIPIVTTDRILRFLSYETLLDTADAADWTAKVAGELTRMDVSRSGLARRNLIHYEEDVRFINSPDAALTVEDATLEDSKELYALPFAASNGSVAEHYKVSSEFDEETLTTTYTAEDVDIKPRVFGWTHGADSVRRLVFPDRLRAAGLKTAYYDRFQGVIRKPVIIEAPVRLNELDLAGLDFTRPVYLAQTGRYYAILKVQTSDTDLCKVELIQLP